MPPPPSLALLLLLAELFQVDGTRFNYTERGIRALDPSAAGCVHEGRWHAAGALVRTREACLRCACGRGALSCRRRACAPLPDPPPRRCHVLHRKGACCPELHCPDGVQLMELGASARLEDEEFSGISSSPSVGHACVEGGTVYSAGSALAPGAACEQCFCLGGARRCVRPRCLPPPPGCTPRPAPGACCPQRFYCDHAAAPHHDTHDCEVEGAWFSEGERVPVAERRGSCIQCFCLRGAVRCQPLACAPPLLGCAPLLRPGECCPHQYHCDHTAKPHQPISHNSLISVRNDDRSLHTSKSNKQETSTKSISTSIATKTSSPLTSATKKMTMKMVTTAKVKRKTNDSPLSSTSQKPAQNISSTTVESTPSSTVASTTEKLVRSDYETSTTEDLSETTTTEQPESSVRIMINGTINCTAELSSTSVPLNLTTNDTDRIKMEAQPRIPIITTENMESHTFNPNDIITDRSVSGDFDEDEMFTVNVTSSLSTNTSRVTLRPAVTTVSKISVPTEQPSAVNMSKKTNEFDFDYAEPTLPPSLPNLKIIPFVAADAVVEEDETPKEVLTYPILEREDKYPVYYPTLEAKVTPFASRRKDVYHPTQYPVFTSEKVGTSQYPTLSHEIDITSSDYPTANNDLLHEHSVSTSIGSQILELNKAVTNTPSTSTTFRLEAPSVNLFSPPVETEGGFIPKGPGIIDEYYAVYPSTPSAPSVPHLTTSMQLDTVKECISSDGHRVLEGESVSLACSVCTCAWSEMHCAPRPCSTPDGCHRRPATSSTGDICCGELICDTVTEKETTTMTTATTERSSVKTNNTSTTNEKANETLNKINLSKNDTKTDKTASSVDNKNDLNVDMTENTSPSRESQKQDILTSSPVEVTSTVATTYSTTTTTTTSTTTTMPDHKESNDTNFHAPDYEEEEDDEGLSFGSVLKLLLSDSYDTTTASPYKKKPSPAVTRPPPTKIATKPPPLATTRGPAPKPSIASFIPMPHYYPYMPPKKSFHQNTVNRIDHLVLGEATAIKKTTSRPTTSPFKPVTATSKPATATLKPVTTQKPFYTTRSTTTRKEVQTSLQTTVSPEEQRPLGPKNVLPGVGGLLKLAGCNIYGQMYRVGRIIAELSTPCQECRCTELGVQCRPLSC